MESRTLPWHAVIVVALVGELAAQASATVIDTLTDWNNAYNVNSFGEGTTPTYGQTVTVPADNILDSFTFKLLQGGGNPTTIRFFVMAWGGDRVTGPVLFSTGPITLIQNTQFYQDYAVDAGRLSLVSGNQYALFFTSFLDYDGVNDASSAAARLPSPPSEDPYTGGLFILNNHAMSLAGLAAGVWQTDFLGTSDLAFRAEFSSLPIGDYNQNGVVDAADYVVWRKTDGTSTGYSTWRTHFGQTFGSGSGVSANAAVPEPATLMLMVLATTGWCLRRGRSASRVSKLVNA
jgi:PEP-CTERM motif